MIPLCGKRRLRAQVGAATQAIYICLVFTTGCMQLSYSFSHAVGELLIQVLCFVG
jgi:hypothetical protein